MCSATCAASVCAATELGPVGWLGGEPAEVSATLERFGLRAVGGFVPLALHGSDLHAKAEADALRAAELLHGAGAEFFVTALVVDDAWSPPFPLEPAQWRDLDAGLRLVDELCAAHGLRQVLHPHVGTLVEDKDDVGRALDVLDVAWVLDTGHLAIGGLDPTAFAVEHGERVALVHLKDVDTALARAVRAHELDLGQATRAGLFRPLGQGEVDVAGTVSALEHGGYAGWYVFEQDVAISYEGLAAAHPDQDVQASIRFLESVVARSTPGGARPPAPESRVPESPVPEPPLPGLAESDPAERADELGVAVIGVGRIGRMHAGILARQLPGARLAAVVDVSAVLAAKVGGELGVPARRSEEVLADAAVDIVAVCSSTDTHVELIVAAAQAGKAIFCEKPVSLDLSSVDRALDAVRRAGVPLMVGFNRRFDPAHAAVHDAVARGEVGEPHLARISSRDPAPPPLSYVQVSGGIFLDMTIHDFDMARYLTGSEVVEVYAEGLVRIEPDFAGAGDVDTAVVVLRHENGCLTTIDNSRRAVYGYDQRVEVFGSLGMAASENAPAHSASVRTASGTATPALPYFFLERYAASYRREWEAVVEAVRAGTAPPVSGEDGRAALVIGLAAWRSLREHRPVAVSEVEAPGS